MVSGKKIPEELFWAIIHMQFLLQMETAVHISGVSKQNIHQDFKLFKDTGKPYAEAAIRSDWPSCLTADEVGVSIPNPIQFFW